MVKKCKKCDTLKPLTDFSATVSMCMVCDRARAKAHYHANRDQYLARERKKREAWTPEEREKARLASAAWYRDNPERVKINRLRKYGLTLAGFRAMVTDQSGRCAICREAPEAPGLVVDHDHTTGRVRALLCGPCNRGIGKFRESPDRLRAAAAYCERWASPSG